jgi:hypothetical protein
VPPCEHDVGACDVTSWDDSQPLGARLTARLLETGEAYERLQLSSTAARMVDQTMPTHLVKFVRPSEPPISKLLKIARLTPSRKG